MDNSAMMLLGMVKMKHPSANHVELVKVTGFDVLGFLLPFVRLLMGGRFGLAALFVCGGFIAYPLWAWYLGFNYNKMNFEAKLASGWTIVKDGAEAQASGAKAA